MGEPRGDYVRHGLECDAAECDGFGSGDLLVYTGDQATITPNAGPDTLSVAFTPTDTVDYTTATATVSIAVGQRGDAGDYMGESRGHHLRHSTERGTVERDGFGCQEHLLMTLKLPQIGAIPTAGTDTLSVTFTPTDTTDYTTATKTVSHGGEPGHADDHVGDACGRLLRDHTERDATERDCVCRWNICLYPGSRHDPSDRD